MLPIVLTICLVIWLVCSALAQHSSVSGHGWRPAATWHWARWAVQLDGQSSPVGYGQWFPRMVTGLLPDDTNGLSWFPSAVILPTDSLFPCQLWQLLKSPLCFNMSWPASPSCSYSLVSGTHPLCCNWIRHFPLVHSSCRSSQHCILSHKYH